MDFAVAHDSARTSAETLNKIGDSGLELSEALDSVDLQPDILAQIIMNHLPHDDQADGTFRMSSKEKTFWALIADYMGTDYRASFAHVSGFMKKISEF